MSSDENFCDIYKGFKNETNLLFFFFQKDMLKTLSYIFIVNS